ncbi:hypothetical protein PIB30_113736, partial [Stylosanthes scabra]|nr:hypothetical protein [Stylosanthes scabra]
AEDRAMGEWTRRMDIELWAQYKDNGRRFGHMTTNMSECINSVLKGTLCVDQVQIPQIG